MPAIANLVLIRMPCRFREEVISVPLKRIVGFLLLFGGLKLQL